MKKVWFAIVSALILTGLWVTAPSHQVSAASSSQYYKIGMEAGYAPFNWTQNSSKHGAVRIQGSKLWANGYDVQMGKKIARALGKKPIVVKTKWDGLLPSLTSGKIDAIIAGMSPTPARRKSIDFSNTYYASKLTIVVRKDSKYAHATKLSDFKGAKLTAQLSTYHYTAIKQIKGVKRQSAMDDFPAMRVALESGTIDGYVSEIPEGITAEHANNKLTYIHFAKNKGFKTDASDTDLAIGLRKQDPNEAKINQVLAGISTKERNHMMTQAVKDQPVTNSSGNWFTNILKQYGAMLLRGTGMTLLLALIGTLVGFIIGLLVGIVRTIPRAKKARPAGLDGYHQLAVIRLH